MVICEDILHLWASFPMPVAMSDVTLIQFAKHSVKFLLTLWLESASENIPFGRPFENLDDHSLLTPKGNTTLYPTLDNTK